MSGDPRPFMTLRESASWRASALQTLRRWMFSEANVVIGQIQVGWAVPDAGHVAADATFRRVHRADAWIPTLGCGEAIAHWLRGGGGRPSGSRDISTRTGRSSSLWRSGGGCGR